MLYLYVSLAFFAGFAFVSGLNLLVVDVIEDRRKHQAIRVREELRLRSAERARAEWKNRQTHYRIAPQAAKQDAALGLLGKWQLVVLQSGIAGIGSEAILIVAVCLALVGAGVTVFFTGKPLFGIPAALVLGVAPIRWVFYRRKVRQKRLLKQLPDAYQMISRGLRSGQTIGQAMRAVSDEVSSPLAEEFAYCWEQQNLGLSPEASLKELAKRTGILEIKIFVVALTINASSGGNLSLLLEKLSVVIREREKMQDKVMALTSEGRMQAYMLVAMPFGLAAMISVVNPTYLLPLLDYKSVVAGMILWMGVGVLWMQRIINFDQ
ncbi:MAG: type II secretion system F family protein [Pirellula sp.]